MRLAVVRQDYDPEGGSERVTERALEALLERNVAVSLYTRSWPATRLQLIEPVICDPFHAGALWRDWGFARAACRSIRRANPTLVESHDLVRCCDVYLAGDGVHAVRVEEHRKYSSAAERAASRCSLREAYRVHAERRLFASPWLRAVICKSAMVRDEIRDRFAVPEGKLKVIYNPVDSGIFHPGLRSERAGILAAHGIAADATVFLAVAKDDARTRAETAVDAIALLPSGERLIVVGGAVPAGRCRERARDLGVSGRVTLAGAPADLRPYFGAADAVLLPSIYDPAPDAALEAMACGLPLVTSTKSGVAELVREHDAGFVFASGDTASVAAHLAALADPVTRARMGANARRAVAAFSPAATTLSLVLLYRDLLAASPGGSAPR
jgi:UDP-glucose:(heptosyl)LPS alpha-1,3-glucosyltransferase